MRFLVTGIRGQLGYDVVKELKKRGFNDILEYSSIDMDITNKKQVESCIFYSEPDAVIHCAAYTKVDQAEEEPQKALEVNITGTENIANACKRVGAKLIYISTDYVFDGEKKLNETYETTDICKPINVYGKTKLGGEKAALLNPKTFIVRTSWVFGNNGNNFVKTMLKLSEIKDKIDVISDQYGSPTYTPDLAKLLVDMSLTDKYGIYHATNNGYCSWAEFSEKIFEIFNKKVQVNYITTDEYPTKATRPKNSKLSKNTLVENGFNLLPDYEDALIRYKKELKPKMKTYNFKIEKGL